MKIGLSVEKLVISGAQGNNFPQFIYFYRVSIIFMKNFFDYPYPRAPFIAPNTTSFMKIVPTCFHFQNPRADTMERDVVIVGGGISGLYCAMKLMELKKPIHDIKSITILEKSNRFGGRLDTDFVKVDEDDGQKCQIKEEEGAMRFTDQRDPKSSNMPLLSQLIKDMQMEEDICPFYMKPQAVPPSQNPVPNSNTRYFNGSHFTEWYAEQNPTLWKNLFNLESHEEFKGAGGIIKDIYRKLLDHDNNKSNRQSRFPERADVILAQEDIKLLREYENAEYWTFFGTNSLGNWARRRFL